MAPLELTIEADERRDAAGNVVTPLDEDALERDLLACLVETLEVADLGLSEDLDPLAMEALDVAHEGHAGSMDVDVGDRRRPGAGLGERVHRRQVAQSLDDLATAQVTLDDLVEIFVVDVGVPDGLGVDDQDGSGLAAVEAAGTVDPYLACTMDAEVLAALLDVGARVGRTALVTALAAVFALVGTEEHMVPEE